MQKYPLTTDNMKGQKQETYKLTLSYATGEEVLTTEGGTLLAVLQYMNERAYCFKHGEVDSYHRIRRELLASGGAYSRFFPSVDGMPVQLLIIAESLLPAPAPVYYEPVAPRGPLLPSVQRVIDALPSTAAVLERREASPDFAPVECVSCKESFLQNKLFGNRLCAACLSGERSSVAPASLLEPVAYPAEFREKRGCWEGTHTSYVWQKNHPEELIIRETSAFYVLKRGTAKERRVKKQNIVFPPYPADL
jgi:hypothetical protein